MAARSVAWPPCGHTPREFAENTLPCQDQNPIPLLQSQLFGLLNLKARLAGCFAGRKGGKVFRPPTIFFPLVLHILLGFRQLRDCQYYRRDPMVQRVLGRKRLPDVATLSRMLREADAQNVENLRRLLREMVFERLRSLPSVRVTLDFDGSVQSTGRFAEGTAVG